MTTQYQICLWLSFLYNMVYITCYDSDFLFDLTSQSELGFGCEKTSRKQWDCVKLSFYSEGDIIASWNWKNWHDEWSKKKKKWSSDSLGTPQASGDENNMVNPAEHYVMCKMKKNKTWSWWIFNKPFCIEPSLMPKAGEKSDGSVSLIIVVLNCKWDEVTHPHMFIIKVFTGQSRSGQSCGPAQVLPWTTAQLLLPINAGGYRSERMALRVWGAIKRRLLHVKFLSGKETAITQFPAWPRFLVFLRDHTYLQIHQN